MLLDDLLVRNRDFVRGRESRPLPDPGAIRAAFVACYDPRLDALVRPALGLLPGEGIVLRTAGALVRPEGDPLRSLVLAVFLFGVTEIYVIAHSSCRMRTFTAAPFIETFRARGVARESFGVQDLRDWAGAFSETRTAVAGSMRAIASAPMLPTDLVVGGLLLDDATGALEVIAPPATIAAMRADPGLVSAPSLPEPPPATTPVVSQHVDGPQRAAKPAPVLAREVEAIRGFVRALETTAAWQDDLAKLRQELDRQRGPLERLTLVEKFIRRASVNARGVAVAFEQLKKETASARANLGPEDLVDLFRRVGRSG